MIYSLRAPIDVADASTNIIKDLGPGKAYGIPYDTAWAALHEEIFPESTTWLTREQMQDGSWGGGVEYFHDRLVSTLASILTLSKAKRSRSYQDQVERGETYLSENLQRVKEEEHSTIGFELLFPTLMEEAERLKLNVPYLHDDYIHRIRETKLSLIYNDLVYNGNTSLSFSAEFLGDAFDITKARELLNPNGSVGNSPSATAYYLISKMKPEAFAYLETVLGVNADGSVLPVYPFDVFEKTWAFYHFDKLDLPVKSAFRRHLKAIKDSWSKRGVGITKHAIIDSDDAAVAFNFLASMGESPDPNVFNNWEKDDFFQCFEYERDPSLSSNVHILDSVKDLKGYRNRDDAVDKILSFLESGRRGDGSWQDKWHLSPFYITSHAVIAVHGLNDKLVEDAVSWILENQKPNGMWGFNNGTKEETAYALWTLLYYNDHVTPIDEQILIQGLDQLAQRGGAAKHEELWIAKGLYCPVNVVDSLILAVLHKAEKAGLMDPLRTRRHWFTAPEITTEERDYGLG